MAHEVVTVEADGVRGDRKRGTPRHVVLVAEEGWKAACDTLGVVLDPRERRGQIVVRGVDLAAAVGQRLQVGDVVLDVVDECTPCGRMNQVQPGLKEALRRDVRAGVFATVVRPGTIQVGASVLVRPSSVGASTDAKEDLASSPAAAPLRIALVLAPVFGDYGSPISLGLAYLAGALRRAGMVVDILDASTRIRDGDPQLFADLMGPGFPSPDGGTIALDVELLLEVLFPGSSARAMPLAKRIRAAARVDFEALERTGHLDVVGFHVCDANVYYVAALAQALRAEEVPVLFGGPSITDTPTRQLLLALRLCDAAMIGEGDERIGAVVRALAERGDREIEGMTWLLPDGGLRVFPGGGTPRLRGAPLPDLEGMGVKQHGHIPIHSTRGCINACNYCSERWYYPRFRVRPVDEVLAEMAAQSERYDVHLFQFYDLLLNGRERWLEEFCSKLQELGAPYQWDSFFVPQSLGPGSGERLLAAGCSTVRVGVEHLAPRMLRLMGRDDNVRLLEDNITALCQSGVAVQMDLLCGFPGELEDDHRESLERLQRLLACSPGLTVLLNPYSLNVGSPVSMDPASYGVEPILYQPGDLPLGAESARDALAALVVDHRREPGAEVVARRLAELRAAMGPRRRDLSLGSDADPDAAVGQRPAADGVTAERAADADPVPPLQVRMTERCNLNCVFCSAPPSGDDHVVKPQELAERVRTSRASEVVITGGEPTLLRSLPKSVRAARAAGATRVILETNGTLIGAYPQLAEALCSAHVDRFVVSLHGPTAEIADAAFGVPGAFDLAVSGIEALVRSGGKVRVRTLHYAANSAEVAAMRRWCAERFGGTVEWEAVTIRAEGRAANHPELLT